MNIATGHLVTSGFTTHAATVNATCFSRHGGVSTAPFGSSNISYGAGDSDQNVVHNRSLMKDIMSIDVLASASQVHGADIFHVAERPTADSNAGKYDALITDAKGVGLLIQTADCQPVFLYDPVKQAVAAIHSGWRGSVQNITGKTVDKMVQTFSCNPEDMQAYIGPSLGPCCAEFIHYRDELPLHFHSHMAGESHFDFWAITRMQLLERGLKDESISQEGVCTSCSPDYFSYRRACREEDGITGRNGSIICLL